MTNELENWETKINEMFGLTFMFAKISKNIKKYYKYVKLIIDKVNETESLKIRLINEIDNIFIMIIESEDENKEDESKEENEGAEESKEIEIDTKFEILKTLGQFYEHNNIKMNIKFLWKALKKNNLNIIKYILGKVKTDINTKDENGQTAIIQAVISGNFEVVELLYNTGADINISDNNNDNILIHAIKKLNTDSIQKMFENDIIDDKIINKQNKFGNTALIIASNNGRTDIVRLLLGYGADRNIKNNKGQTAFDTAKSAEIANLVVLRTDKQILNPIEKNGDEFVFNDEQFRNLLNHPNINLEFDNKNTILHNVIIYLINEMKTKQKINTKFFIRIIDDILAKKDINVDKQNQDGNTALMLLVEPIPNESEIYRSDRADTVDQQNIEIFKSEIVEKILGKTKKINIINKKKKHY
jgi:ankyrin repeat protein